MEKTPKGPEHTAHRKHASRGDRAGSAVGRPQGQFRVDASGQATYRFPIEVPPGTAGAQPSLDLVYSHRLRNGVVGVGWSVSGLSAITRAKPSYAVDGFSGPITNTAKDRFILDGQRLVNMRGDYGAPGTIYNTEMQSWRFVVASAEPGGGFIVSTQSGATWEYGMTADSRVLVAGTETVRVWALNATVDRNGNRTEFHYTRAPRSADGVRGEPDEGMVYIDTIAYSMNEGQAAQRSVKFTYEPRPDPILEFSGGASVSTRP